MTRQSVIKVWLAERLILARAAALTWARPEARLPRGVAVAGFLFWGLAAGVHAWLDALRGDFTPSWEPTPRELT